MLIFFIVITGLLLIVNFWLSAILHKSLRLTNEAIELLKSRRSSVNDLYIEQAVSKAPEQFDSEPE